MDWAEGNKDKFTSPELQKKLWGGGVIKYVALQILVRVDKSKFPPPLMGESKGGGDLESKNEL